MNGLCQSVNTGIVPGNRNAEYVNLCVPYTILIDCSNVDLALKEFDEHDHTFVCPVRDVLPNSEAICDSMRVMRRVRREAHVDHVV